MASSRNGDDRRLLIVVGLEREATIVAGLGRVVVGASDLSHALARARAVISFGLCGGLSHGPRAGDLVIGAGASCDAAWSAALARGLPGARSGRVVGLDQPAATRTQKARLGAATGAVAVDMESHAVAAAARAARLPFAILRAVSDPLERGLPSAALAGFRPDGRPDIGRVLLGLARRPWELPALIRTAVDAEAAFAALGNARDLLGPGLGCPYLV